MGMNTQAQQTTPLTRRQVAARKCAVAQKAINQAAKAWLVGRQDSATPVADRLIARHMRKCGTDAVYATTLLQNSLICRNSRKISYFQRHYVAGELRGLFFNPAGTCLADAVALMREAGIPAKYWGRAAMELATQKKAKARRSPLLPGDENGHNNNIA